VFPRSATSKRQHSQEFGDAPGTELTHRDSRSQEATRIRERLARLGTETAELTARLAEIEASGSPVPDSERPPPP